MSRKNDDDGIYRVDTVPPPAGEDDAYNAPTRVGPMASAIVEEIIAQARREAEEAAASSRPPGTPASDEDEAVVIDPAQLMTLEALTAQMNEGLQAPKPLPDLHVDVSHDDVADESRPTTLAATPSDPPVLAAAPKPASDPPPEQLAPTTRKSGASSTIVLLLLILALGAFGFWLLRHGH